MEASFWKERWGEGRTAFHEGRPNTYLARHAARLAGARRVLVPLCGKADDLAYLAGLGHEVVGVELVEDAARAFFAEHDATPTVSARGPFTAYQAGAITILTGDFFATTAALAGPIDGLYDRAALVALPPPMRARYVKHVRDLLAIGGRGLVITLEYPEGTLEGPPFSVLEAELHAHYRGARVELLDEGKAEGARLTGIDGARERCFFVEV